MDNGEGREKGEMERIMPLSEKSRYVKVAQGGEGEEERSGNCKSVI